MYFISMFYLFSQSSQYLHNMMKLMLSLSLIDRWQSWDAKVMWTGQGHLMVRKRQKTGTHIHIWLTPKATLCLFHNSQLSDNTMLLTEYIHGHHTSNFLFYLLSYVLIMDPQFHKSSLYHSKPYSIPSCSSLETFLSITSSSNIEVCCLHYGS
jgi:hypothetical protein